MRFERVEASDVLWLDERHELSLTELLALSGLSDAELQHLVACEVLSPAHATEPAAPVNFSEARFGAQCVAIARTAARLRNDFELDPDALVLTLRLIDRIHELETELTELRAQRPR